MNKNRDYIICFIIWIAAIEKVSEGVIEMKTINIIKTAKELIDFAKPTRTKGDISPFLGAAAKLIFENNYQYIQL